MVVGRNSCYVLIYKKHAFEIGLYFMSNSNEPVQFVVWKKAIDWIIFYRIERLQF